MKYITIAVEFIILSCFHVNNYSGTANDMTYIGSSLQLTSHPLGTEKSGMLGGGQEHGFFC